MQLKKDFIALAHFQLKSLLTLLNWTTREICTDVCTEDEIFFWNHRVYIKWREPQTCMKRDKSHRRENEIRAKIENSEVI